MTAVAIIHKDSIIEQVAKGVRLADIAKPLGISSEAISKQLKHDPDYQQAMISYHASRLDKAEAMIEAASDQVDVARARALWSSYCWRAEREQSRIWGQRQEVTSITSYRVDIRAVLEQRDARIRQVPELSADETTEAKEGVADGGQVGEG